MQRVVNDFSLAIFSINGTGTLSACNFLAKLFFRLGVPISAKNIFPSNIQGLPTTYRIRLSSKRYLGAKERDEILVLLNPNTFHEDLKLLQPGSVYFYAASPKMQPSEAILQNSDYIGYPIPIDELARPSFAEIKLRNLMKNMIMLGAVIESLGIAQAGVDELIESTFPGKATAIESNKKAVGIGREYFSTTFKKSDPFVVEPMTPHAGKIFIDGNTLSALGTVMAGCTFASWYPITPSSSVMETIDTYFKKYRAHPTGNRFAILQCEDEISCIGTVVGAGFAGARAMTATSGPGLSLMTEILGLAYYTETPCVVWDIQRVGPSTGLPTRTQQGDLLFAACLGHGDSKHPLLIPRDPTECYEMAGQAFDLAERFQTPVFVMSDLDIGMNLWICDEPTYPTQPFNRGKVLSPADLDRLKAFSRYKDVDGDGVPYRTIPGNPHPMAPFFVRGSGHNENAVYSENPDVYERMMARLERKWQSLKAALPAPVLEVNPGSSIGLIAYGSSHEPVLEALDRYRDQKLSIDYLRIRSYPFSESVREFINRHETVLVVDQNRDAQMKSLIQLSFDSLRVPLVSIALSNGMPLTAERLMARMDDELKRSSAWTPKKTG